MNLVESGKYLLNHQAFLFFHHIKWAWVILSLWNPGSLTSYSTSLFSVFQCLPADKLAIYSVSEQSRLDEQGFLELCPTMLQQLATGTCRLQGKEELSADASPRPTDTEGKHWLFTHLNSFWHYWIQNKQANGFRSLSNIQSWTFYVLKDNILKSVVIWVVKSTSFDMLLSTYVLQLIPEACHPYMHLNVWYLTGTTCKIGI